MEWNGLQLHLLCLQNNTVQFDRAIKKLFTQKSKPKCVSKSPQFKSMSNAFVLNDIIK